MKKQSKIVIFCLLLILYACTNIHDRLSSNSWIIRTIKYENDNNLIFKFSSNSLHIRKDRKSRLPALFSEEFSTTRTARCNYFKKNKKQYIYFDDTENWYFKDTFELRILDKENIELANEKKQLKLIDARVGWDSNNYHKGIE